MSKRLQPRNQVYELWIAQDFGQAGMIPGDTQQYELLTHDTEGEEMVLVASFTATSWTRAKEAIVARMEIKHAMDLAEQILDFEFANTTHDKNPEVSKTTESV